MRLDTAPVALLLALSLMLGGCIAEGDNETADDGADDGMTETPTPEPVVTDVSVGLSGVYPATIAYDPSEIEVDAGVIVNLTFTNDDQNVLVPHDWVLEGVDNASTEVIGNGQSANVSFAAPAPGDYAFYCSVQGHRGNGMEGVFRVLALNNTTTEASTDAF